MYITDFYRDDQHWYKLQESKEKDLGLIIRFDTDKRRVIKKYVVGDNVITDVVKILGKPTIRSLNESLLCEETIMKLPGWVHSKRYDVSFNLVNCLVPFDRCDTKHKILKMRYLTRFSRAWKDVNRNYDRYEPFFRNFMWARQCFLALCMTTFNIDKVIRSRRLHWLLDETPDFYHRGLVLYNVEVEKRHCGHPDDFALFCDGGPESTDRDCGCEFDENPVRCESCKWFRRSRKTKIFLKFWYPNKAYTKEVLKLYSGGKGVITTVHAGTLWRKFPNAIPKCSNILNQWPTPGSVQHDNIREIIAVNIDQIYKKSADVIADMMKYGYYKKVAMKIISDISDNADLFQKKRKYQNYMSRISRAIIQNM